MEDPNLNDFDDVFKEIMSDESTTELFGAVGKMEETIPELFVPTELIEYKKQLQELNPEADVDHLTEFDILIKDLEGVHAQRMNKVLGNMTDSEFVINYNRLLNYVKPKYKAIDGESFDPQELTQINVTVINSKDELDETKTVPE